VKPATTVTVSQEVPAPLTSTLSLDGVSVSLLMPATIWILIRPNRLHVLLEPTLSLVAETLLSAVLLVKRAQSVTDAVILQSRHKNVLQVPTKAIQDNLHAMIVQRVPTPFSVNQSVTAVPPVTI
jgi:type IV secretory pathway ATPase VirB11/archaellum biosynthesis ATPase